MSESEFDARDLGAFEQRLRELRPAASGIDRDRLMFRLGQASMQQRRSLQWVWPLTTAAMALVAISLALYRTPQLASAVVETTETVPPVETIEFVESQPVEQRVVEQRVVDELPRPNFARPHTFRAGRLTGDRDFDAWLAASVPEMGTRPFLLGPGQLPPEQYYFEAESERGAPRMAPEPLRAGDRALWRDAPRRSSIDDLLSNGRDAG